MIGHEPIGCLGQIDRRRMRATVARAASTGSASTHIRPGAMVADLSLADRQLVEIFKALSRDPRLLILDEGTSALGRKEVERLFALLRKLKTGGTSVVFISHRMSEIREFVDRMSVFRNGRHVGTVAAAEASDEEIVEMMLGERVERSFPESADVSAEADVLLEVETLSAGAAAEGRVAVAAARRGPRRRRPRGAGAGRAAARALRRLSPALRRDPGAAAAEVRLGTPWRAKARRHRADPRGPQDRGSRAADERAREHHVRGAGKPRPLRLRPAPRGSGASSTR